MSNDRLEQQINQLAEQQSILREDVARIKEHMDYLSAVMVSFGEQQDGSGASDEEGYEDLEQALEVVNDQINQLATLIGQVLEAVTRQGKQVSDLYGHNTENCKQITRVYERLNEVLETFDVVLRHTGAQDAEDEQEAEQEDGAEEAAAPYPDHQR